MHDILCIYFSRSGNTRAAAEQIAAALDAELAEITDGQDRSGLKGETVRYSVKPHKLFVFHKETEQRLAFEVK